MTYTILREHMEQNALQALLDTCTVKRFSKGEVVLYQGEVPRHFYMVKSGVVKVYGITASGEERIATFEIEGEFFPTSWMMRKTPGTVFFYEAFTDAELYIIDQDNFTNFTKQNVQALTWLVQYFADAYVGSLMQISALEHAKASEKVLHTLYYLVLRYGKKITPKVTRIQLQLTHQDFANLVGLTRETTALELSKLKKAGVISYRTQRYLVKVTSLLELIGEDRFKDMKI